jgi:membrane-associated phospholipid phosphatase
MNTKLFFIFFDLSKITIIRDVAWFLSYPMQYILPLGIIAWVLWKSPRKIFALSLLFLSGFCTWLATLVLKQIFMIPRPFLYLGITPVVSETNFSFPSNHASFFAALAVVTLFLDKRVGIFVSACAVLIGFSRIVLGVHTPLDIFAGFCLGICISFFFIKIFTHKTI